jgi:hypothetical protein
LSPLGLSYEDFEESAFPLATLRLDFLMLGLLKRLSASWRFLPNGRPEASPLLPGGREELASLDFVILFLIRNAVSLLDFVSSLQTCSYPG